MKATSKLNGIDDRMTAARVELANYSRIVFSKAVQEVLGLAKICAKHINPVPTLILWLLDCGLIYSLLMYIRAMNIVSTDYLDSWQGLTIIGIAIAVAISIYHQLIIYLNKHMFRNLP